MYAHMEGGVLYVTFRSNKRRGKKPRSPYSLGSRGIETLALLRNKDCGSPFDAGIRPKYQFWAQAWHPDASELAVTTCPAHVRPLRPTRSPQYAGPREPRRRRNPASRNARNGAVKKQTVYRSTSTTVLPISSPESRSIVNTVGPVENPTRSNSFLTTASAAA